MPEDGCPPCHQCNRMLFHKKIIINFDLFQAATAGPRSSRAHKCQLWRSFRAWLPLLSGLRP
jgi:hypothetical protein